MWIAPSPPFDGDVHRTSAGHREWFAVIPRYDCLPRERDRRRAGTGVEKFFPARRCRKSSGGRRRRQGASPRRSGPLEAPPAAVLPALDLHDQRRRPIRVFDGAERQIIPDRIRSGSRRLWQKPHRIAPSSGARRYEERRNVSSRPTHRKALHPARVAYRCSPSASASAAAAAPRGLGGVKVMPTSCTVPGRARPSWRRESLPARRIRDRRTQARDLVRHHWFLRPAPQ